MTKEQRQALIENEMNILNRLRTGSNVENWPTDRLAILEFVRHIDEILEIYNAENRVVS